MAIWKYTDIMSHHLCSKAKAEKKWWESSSFIQKLKAFNVSNAWQLCLATVLSHVESLGNFKNKYKIKKEKVRNQTIHNKVQQKKKKNTRRRRTDPTEKKKKKKKGRGRQTDQQRRRRKKGSAKKKKKKKEGDKLTDREEEEKKERRRRSSCFMTPPLLHHRLLSFLLLLCFLSLQMMFWPGIHLPAKTAGFRRHNQYATSTAGIFSSMK